MLYEHKGTCGKIKKLYFDGGLYMYCFMLQIITLYSPDSSKSGPYSLYRLSCKSGLGLPWALHEITTRSVSFLIIPVLVLSNTTGSRTTTSAGASIVWLPFVAL